MRRSGVRIPSAPPEAGSVSVAHCARRQREGQGFESPSAPPKDVSPRAVPATGRRRSGRWGRPARPVPGRRVRCGRAAAPGPGRRACAADPAPVPAEAEAVDPGHTLAPGTVSRKWSTAGRPRRAARQAVGPAPGSAAAAPGSQRCGTRSRSMRRPPSPSAVPVELSRPDQALGLADAGAVVDPALVLDDDLEPAASARQHDRPVVLFPVEDADGSPSRNTRARSRTSSTVEDARPVEVEARSRKRASRACPRSSSVGRTCSLQAPQGAGSASSRTGSPSATGCPAPVPAAPGHVGRHRRVPGDDLAERVVLRGRVAGLVERRVVVVAR